MVRMRADVMRRSFTAVLLLAVGCSSSHTASASDPRVASTAAPTTAGLPFTSAETTRATASFFEGVGAPLLSVERASQSLMTGQRPTRTACEQFVRDLKSTVPASSKLVVLAQQIPDRSVRDAIQADLNNKFFLVQACVSQTGLNDSADEERVFALYRDRSQRVVALLARDHIHL